MLTKKSSSIFLSVTLVVVFFSGAVSALNDDTKESCSAVSSLINDNNIDAALEEARWCVEALEQFKQAGVSKLFHKTVEGWKRASLDENKAMGMTITEAVYEKNGSRIEVQLMGGAGGGMGSLGMLAQLGMMGSGKKLRIQRRTAMDMSQGSRSELIVNLKNGGNIIFKSKISIDDVVSLFKLL